MANPKRQMTMQQAIIVMVVGGLLLFLAIVIPTEAGSSAQMWKVLMGIVGACILAAGLYLRPMKSKAEHK